MKKNLNVKIINLFLLEFPVQKIAVMEKLSNAGQSGGKRFMDAANIQTAILLPGIYQLLRSAITVGHLI